MPIKTLALKIIASTMLSFRLSWLNPVRQAYIEASKDAP